MLKAIIRRLFVTDNFFTIAIKKHNGNILNQLRFDSDYTIPATREEWYADPFLAEDGAHTYLFYEKVHGDLGSIEVAEIRPDGSLSQPVLLLGGQSHYSYPYVFRKDDKWYMIPESSALNEVGLYVAEEFPYYWKKISVLLKKPAVDTTVFQYNNQWFLLTFIPDRYSERVMPFAYRMDGTRLEPMEWNSYDPLSVRGAGCPFWYQGSLYRPVQVSTDQRYGDRVAFAKIEINGNRYREEIETNLFPKSIKARAVFYDGLHTYNCSEHFEVIDIRCGSINLLKPIKKITCLLRKQVISR